MLVATHSKTLEGKDKPGMWMFKDSTYTTEFARMASEVQEQVEREIGRLNSIVELELVHLRGRVLPLLSARLAAATQLWHELMSVVNGAAVPAPPSLQRAPSPSLPASPAAQAASSAPVSALRSPTPPPPPAPASLSSQQHSDSLTHHLLQQQCCDASTPLELRKCAADVLHFTRLEAAAQDRMRRPVWRAPPRAPMQRL